MDVDTFHFSRATRLISSKISKDQGRDSSGRELDGERGGRAKREKRKKLARGKGREVRGKERKVEKDGANS